LYDNPALSRENFCSQVPTILAMVLGRFEVELAEQMGGYEGLLARQINAFTLSLKGGCHLRFRSRASL
jgi:hypothetical protein